MLSMVTCLFILKCFDLLKMSWEKTISLIVLFLVIKFIIDVIFKKLIISISVKTNEESEEE